MGSTSNSFGDGRCAVEIQFALNGQAHSEDMLAGCAASFEIRAIAKLTRLTDPHGVLLVGVVLGRNEKLSVAFDDSESLSDLSSTLLTTIHSSLRLNSRYYGFDFRGIHSASGVNSPVWCYQHRRGFFIAAPNLYLPEQVVKRIFARASIKEWRLVMSEDSGSDAAKELSKLGAAKGGEARAKKLSPERRREIAQTAIEARWAKAGKATLPKATHAGPVKLGNAEIPSYVLDTGERILSTRGIMSALKRTWRGRKYSGTELPVFLEANNLKPFISDELRLVLTPRIFRANEGAKRAEGFKAEVLPQVCEVYLTARDAGVLTTPQKVVAKQCEILMRGLAHVGIVALVDEATGYQDQRAKDALAKILEAFIAKELRKWISTFPVDYYKQLFRLRGWKFPELPKDQTKRPILVGKITNDVVYDRLAPGVRQRLHELTPRNEKGRLKNKLFMRLTEDVGDPKLREHLASVVVLMKASDTWEQFMNMLDRSLPRYSDTPYLPFQG
jgi:hypothetical protein